MIGADVFGSNYSRFNRRVDAFGNALGSSLAYGGLSGQGGSSMIAEQEHGLQLSLNDGQEARLQSGQTMTDYGDGYADGVGDLASSTGAVRKANSRTPSTVTIYGLLDSDGKTGEMVPIPSSPIDMSPTKANAIRLGLMSPDGQTDGTWSSAVPPQSELEMHVLPPIDQSYYVAPGLVTSSYQQAVAMWSDSRMPWDERAIGFVGAALTSPMMLLEETGRALMNVPYYDNQIGQNAAQFSLAETNEGKVTAALQFTQNASAGILGGLAMVPGSVSMGVPVRTAEEMAVAQFAGTEAMNGQIWNERRVMIGHGGVPQSETFVVPHGSSITFYAEPGASITNSLGNEIEAGLVSPRLYSKTYMPGEVAPNPNLGKIPDSWISKNVNGTSIRVDSPTSLSELLAPNMGQCHWAACMTNPSLPGYEYTFSTLGKVQVKP